jgi:autotransporter translocation and assembly factor TamB
MKSSARLTGHASFLTIFGQRIETAAATFSLIDRRLGFDVNLTRAGGRTGTLAGAFVLRSDQRALDLDALSIEAGGAPWRLARGPEPATIAWSDEGINVSPLEFVAAGAPDQRISVSGTWRRDGNGALRIAATHVFLETLQGALPRPARYGGVIDLDGTFAGTRAAPRFSGHLTISNGRVQRVSYERLEARVDYAAGVVQIDARLDQAPGAWITAVGHVPFGLFNRSLPARDIDVAIASSPLSLGLIEGLTGVIRNVTGEVQLDVKASGTTHDPLFQGGISVSNAAFLVTPTGVRYKNGHVALSLAQDRMTVGRFHVEDNNGRPLDVHGSLATRELSVGDLVIDASARHFKVIRNEFGDLDVDATLQLRGQLDTPRIAGEISIAGGDLKVDTILERLVFRPYATEASPLVESDAVAALNPWSRLSLDLTLHVPETLKLTGENLQVSPGTPVGLGDINLRVGGDLSLYKDPGQRLAVTGSLDSIRGTYAFQGRRFDVDPASSINFRGDLTPEIDVSVSRLISGVLTRVTVIGDLNNPQLHLSSTPPLDPSEILSLIVFNASLNDLSTPQQQELAVRAGTIAAAFLAEPLVSAIEGALGLETLEVEPGGDFGVGVGPKVTVGEEIAPGLVARFSRQFGQDSYDQATVEYYLSRLFHIRATFSDAASLIARAPFHRIERAGVDLLFFFSF